METLVKDTVKEANDAKTRLMNAQAKAAVKNINTNKPISTNVKKEAPKVDKPKVVKEPKITFASKLDSIILSGGTWETLIAKATEAGKALECTTKVNTALLKAHINFRVKRTPDFIKGMTVTDEGVIKSVSKKK